MVTTPTFVSNFLRRRALSSGKSVNLWRRFGSPNLADWADYLRHHGGFRAFGTDCMMSPDNVFNDRYLTKIGSRVRIAGAWIAGHDGSTNMVNRTFGSKLDAVGPVVIGDDVFIGYGAIILPKTTIGNRVIVGAGSVVSGNVPDDSVDAGAPARRVRSLEEHFERQKVRNESYPWKDQIVAREGGYDPRMEPGLRAARIDHFFPE